MARDDASLDAVLDRILDRFESTHRLDRGHERLRAALRKKLRERGYEEPMLRLLEVNLFGSLTGWMEHVLEENSRGGDAVGDFARHLRHAFLEHCRQHEIEADRAVAMAVELANGIMELAVAYRRHLNLDGDGQSG